MNTRFIRVRFNLKTGALFVNDLYCFFIVQPKLKNLNMAMEDLPRNYDAIILGTGMPESILAAALARIGMKVLHLDRNDYYSGGWATLNWMGLNQWIERNQEVQGEFSGL